MQGSATFGNAWIRGRLIVGYDSSYGSGVIQSAYYYPGSSGFRIDSAGWVEFNSATINAGLFKSQNNRYTSVEVGDTGANDWVDEVRMFSSYTVSSIRNPSFAPGSLFFNVGAQMTLRTSNDGWPFLHRGSPGQGPGFKWTTLNSQARDANDNYGPLACSALTQTSELKFKKGVQPLAISDKKSILKKNGTHKWEWKNSPYEVDSGYRYGHGLIADYLPEWTRAPDGYDTGAVIAFLWDSLSEAYDRIEALEKKAK
jgi:hypothetical protein